MQTFRDEIAPFLGSRQERRKMLRDINAIERTELGLPPVPRPDPAVALQQKRYMERISTPKSKPESTFNNFILAPSSLKGKKTMSKDGLFSPAPGTDTFWLYGVQKVTQSTLGVLAKEGIDVSDAELFRSQVVQSVMSKIDNMAEKAKGLGRCGVLFDIISTSKIIEGMLPHRVGSFIYEYIETKHSNLVMIKFVFVGITDNVNCCAARDVFCRDEMLTGKYIGQTKRNFDALDNIHIFPVMPPNLRPSSRLSEAPGGAADNQVLSTGGGFSSFLTSLDSPMTYTELSNDVPRGEMKRSPSSGLPPSQNLTGALKNKSSFNIGRRRSSTSSEQKVGSSASGIRTKLRSGVEFAKGKTDGGSKGGFLPVAGNYHQPLVRPSSVL